MSQIFMPKERTVTIDEKKISLPQTKGEVLFWKFIDGGLDKKEAYIKAFPNSDPKYASTYASRIYNKEKFNSIKESLWDKYKKDAPKAYKIQKGIMENPSTDDDLRNRISDKIQDRAGFSPIAKTAQLRLNANIANPLLEKTAEELKLLSQKTNALLGEVKKEMVNKKIGQGHDEVIEGEVIDGEG